MEDGNAPKTGADEVAALQQRVESKKAECSQLMAALAQASAEKARAQQAALSGIKAGKTHMERLRSELALVKRWTEAHPTLDANRDASGTDVAAGVGAEGGASEESSPEEKMLLRSHQVQARELRHELSHWKHQVDLHEGRSLKQEDEIVSLKAELTHTRDVYESVQREVKHQEAEREFQAPAGGSIIGGGDTEDQYHVPLHGGGHGSIQAHAERVVRESAENRNINLSGKAKRLSGVVAAQQLLIQRLEKQVLEEERALGQKDRQISQNDQSIGQLKAMVRQHSNNLVAGLLFQRSASVPRLPAI